MGDAPVDGFGAGTSVVTGLGHPTAGLIYKLVAVEGRAVAKRSAGKATVGGRKWAWRLPGEASEVVAAGPGGPPGGRALQSTVIEGGRRLVGPSLEESREFHRRVVSELGPGRSLTISWGEGLVG